MNKEEIRDWFKELQDDICGQIESADGSGKFKEDNWDRLNGGGGRTRVIENGSVIEKGGVNFSAVYGATPQKILDALKLDQADFFATGVSIVMHPSSPMVPIIHMNVRYFEMSNGISWFGGGIDLTPHYVDKEDARYFHKTMKAVCDRHHPDYYKEFKNWADDYFYVKHRNETRGIGGIFFDRLSAKGDIFMEDRWAFVQEVGQVFAPIYTHLMTKNKNLPFGENEKKWQFLRRGRYVEFNLVLDKGTKFGLDTDGRTESILMSLPPQANWVYDYQPTEGSNEAETLSLLKKGINWTRE
ncbi:oxygen-dependent coproporphyrinogen oxidase [Reichenbachiella sp. MALMAid0571]|uniref:oxygen-dependent coproporphyrinogen oxidase n=1 Tax=Reichenbachiella sp. MALMAid0571 TaxID=3143939 RepID=UPI0032DF64DD